MDDMSLFFLICVKSVWSVSSLDISSLLKLKPDITPLHHYLETIEAPCHWNLDFLLNLSTRFLSTIPSDAGIGIERGHERRSIFSPHPASRQKSSQEVTQVHSDSMLISRWQHFSSCLHPHFTFAVVLTSSTFSSFSTFFFFSESDPMTRFLVTRYLRVFPFS